jgi:CRP-like cAMP-binding protein
MSATAADIAVLRGFVDGATLAAIGKHVVVRRLVRGEAFLAAGDRATSCGTITEGLFREYYPLADGREVTRNFAGPGDLVGSLSDLLLERPARSTVTAETAARVIAIPWLVVRDAAPALVARITRELYLAKAEREYELLALDAAARYARFRSRFAALEPVIAQRHVASYIGVTPEHLSRLRRRLAEASGTRSPAKSRTPRR